MNKKTYLWSLRKTFVMGNHWKLEREVADDTSEQWLKIFQHDEPHVEFKISTNKPVIKK